MKKEFEDSINVEFSVSFGERHTDNEGMYDYRNDYDGDIVREYPRYEEDSISIGSIEITQLLLGQAREDGFSTYELIDSDTQIYDAVAHIWDFGESDFIEALLEDNFHQSIIVIKDIKIFPQYRGKGYGERALLEVVRRFAWMGVIVLKAFPKQLEPKDFWEKEMKLELMEQDKRKAKAKLYKLYRKCGFKHTKGVPKEIMTIVKM